MNKLFKALKEPKWFIEVILNKYPWMFSDKLFLKIKYWLVFGKKLNLKNPKTFNEKIQWLKLYDRREVYTQMVDKAIAKDFVANIIGSEYIIPTLGVWENFDDINFDQLPNKFVLKCTHDSGGIVICRDKSKLDIVAAKIIINKSLKRNFYNVWREYAYKKVKPHIIAEKYMIDNLDIDRKLTDYKFFCFNGKVHSVMVGIEREKESTKFYFFDKNWKLLRLNTQGRNEPKGFTLPKPENISEMFHIASKLSLGIPFLRVDLYSVNDKTYFGELTLYPQAGFDPNLLSETDELFGEMIILN